MSTPATLNGQELELFRVGDYGPKGKYTAEDLEGVVSRYSAAGETPIAIGHPEADSAPAFGWLKSVRFSRGTGLLYGTPGDVHPTLDKGWNEKQYRNRSVSFARDHKGQLYLHHCAFLGAVPPVVQGLADAKFSTDTYQEVVFSDDGGNMSEQQIVIAGEDRKLWDRFKAMFSASEAKPGDDMQALEQRLEAKFSADLKAERDARLKVEGEFSTFKASHAGTAAETRAAQAITELKGKGLWIPAYDKIGVPQLFSALAGRAETITFSDAQGAEQKPDLLAALSGVLTNIGQIVPRGNFAAGRQPESGAPVAKDGSAVDASSATFSAMVNQRASEKGIPYNDAREQLIREGKKPASGAAAAGGV